MVPSRKLVPYMSVVSFLIPALDGIEAILLLGDAQTIDVDSSTWIREVKR